MFIRKNGNNQTFCHRGSLRAFTLAELVITVVIISMLAAFAIPNYKKAVRKAYERNAILYLITIHGVNEVYKARNGEYVPGAGLDLAGINGALSINIIDADMSYLYRRATVTTYAATASWTGEGNFTVRVNQNFISASNPCCSAGSCPSLPACS